MVAVSGGPDSVALLRGLARLRAPDCGRLIAAHFNHRLRGTESDEDEAFVVALCHRLAVPCHAGRGEGPAAASPDGLEAAARQVRYAFLQRTAGEHGARYVLTAHTAEDQAETILHRIVRGTGISGLGGMSRVRPLGPITLLRPLLGFRRADVLEYLEHLGQDYRVDSSNADLSLTRNRIRRQLLPQLAADFNPGVADALLRLGGLAREAHEALGELAVALLDRGVVQADGRVRVARTPLGKASRYLVREVLMAVWRQQRWPLQAMGFQQWELLAEMLLNRGNLPAKASFPGNIEVQATEEGLELAASGAIRG
jgi:tRNA(Ile)-lysidine synthase